MTRSISLVAVLAVAIGTSGRAHAQDSPPPAAGLRRITLADAVAAAATDNPELAIARRGVEIAQSKVDNARALRWPSLSVEGTVLYWDEEMAFSVAPGAPSIVAREQLTLSAGATVAWPLSGQLALSRLIGVQRTGVEVARAEVEGGSADVISRTAELYLRIMQAHAGVEIARSALTQLDAQLTRAKALERAGVLGRVDVMRLESARAQAEQQALAASDAEAQAIDALALLLGLDATVRLATVDDLPRVLPAPRWSEAEALEIARARRPELKTATLRARQAEGAIAIQRADYFPGVTAIANYTHTEGQGLFSDPDAFYVGVNVKWTLWDWGARAANVRGAQAQAAQASRAAARAGDQATVEVRAKLRTAQTKHKQLAVAEQGLATSEEAYKLMTARFQGGDATTTDVIDAEAEVTRARLAFTNARFEYAIALVTLSRAIGAPPLAALPDSRAASR